ncbi:Vacuolar protein-sorting-associated protein 36, partial [Coemansia spiralis]
MEPVELAPTLRPLLAAGERIVCVQSRVGLYHGAARDSEHDNGTVYLTTQRIVYVDQQSPRQRSAALGLARVRRRSLHSGFLYASAKISLHLWPLTAAGGEDAPGGAIGGPGTLQSAPGADRPEAGWRCTICEQVNRDGAKCTLCGVPRQADAPDLGLGPSPAMPGADTPDATRCPTCTFDNHTSMARCEMCDSELRPATPTSVDTSSATDAASGTGTEAATAEAADEVIKLSFR